MRDLDRESGRGGANKRWIAGVSALNWVLAFLALIVVWIWVFTDAQFHQTVAWTLDDLSVDTIPFAEVHPVIARAEVARRILYFKGLLALAGLSVLGVATALVLGSRRFRSIAAWLGCMLVISGWIALLLYWPEVAWHGKRFRISQQLQTIESVAAELRTEWPLVDGSVANVGYCSAYPYGSAKVLVVLSPMERAEGAITCQAIERSEYGGLRFQLTGLTHSDWLEWHPEGKRPESFRGGLDEEHILVKSSPIRNGWFLTRYYGPQD